jgi:hypothetical protein
MQRYFYSNSITDFISESLHSILGKLTESTPFAVDQPEKDAWLEGIRILKESLAAQEGRIYLEYSIPRIGRRIDAVLVIKHAVFVIEFKIWSETFGAYAIDQVWDYALDLKNFHETSHSALLVPILVATEATGVSSTSAFSIDVDNIVSPPLKTNRSGLGQLLDDVLAYAGGVEIDADAWDQGRYSPTPTIIEAASALYGEHTVENISRSDASARNLSDTRYAIQEVIGDSERAHKKAICFVTGVPGAGKTLVGLDIATKRQKGDDAKSVFLSGNQPLVSILREALVRDSVARARQRGERMTKTDAMRRVSKFIQNVHHYRDEYLKDSTAPYDHVAIFDEAQRAWNLRQTKDFMRRKKGISDFNQSEPEFLISCLNRHESWAVIVALVGGGQEINRGEAGIGEWLNALNHSFPDWEIHISDRLEDSEYAAGHALAQIEHKERVHVDERLHLSVSMRSYRAENVSSFVKHLLDLDSEGAAELYETIRPRYPLVLTRELESAKKWLRAKARGTERFGILASSSAERLKAKSINVKAPMNPVNWFLESKEDVRSCYFLEDVATEFHCQGLELDWTCVVWDADLRFSQNGWKHHAFRGSSWNNVNQLERKQYLKNAYRVLLTRARQGMVIVVPDGDINDQTRQPDFYDQTYYYLKKIGIEEVACATF